MTIHHNEIFYIDPAVGWALASFDAEGNQLGEAEYSFHRASLVNFAHGNLDHPTEVYTSTGRLHRVLNPEA